MYSSFIWRELILLIMLIYMGPGVNLDVYDGGTDQYYLFAFNKYGANAGMLIPQTEPNVPPYFDNLPISPEWRRLTKTVPYTQSQFDLMRPYPKIPPYYNSSSLHSLLMRLPIMQGWHNKPIWIVCGEPFDYIIRERWPRLYRNRYMLWEHYGEHNKAHKISVYVFKNINRPQVFAAPLKNGEPDRKH